MLVSRFLDPTLRKIPDFLSDFVALTNSMRLSEESRMSSRAQSSFTGNPGLGHPPWWQGESNLDSSAPRMPRPHWTASSSVPIAPHPAALDRFQAVMQH
jgi:hypothetical protein